MNKPTYQDYLANPSAVLEQVDREAHRERAEAVHRFIVAPLLQLFRRTAAGRAPVLQPRPITPSCPASA